MIRSLALLALLVPALAQAVANDSKLSKADAGIAFGNGTSGTLGEIVEVSGGDVFVKDGAPRTCPLNLKPITITRALAAPGSGVVSPREMGSGLPTGRRGCVVPVDPTAPATARPRGASLKIRWSSAAGPEQVVSFFDVSLVEYVRGTRLVAGELRETESFVFDARGFATEALGKGRIIKDGSDGIAFHAPWPTISAKAQDGATSLASSRSVGLRLASDGRADAGAVLAALHVKEAGQHVYDVAIGTAPGISIGEPGVQIAGFSIGERGECGTCITIDESGVHIAGITIDESGVHVDGIAIDESGVHYAGGAVDASFDAWTPPQLELDGTTKGDVVLLNARRVLPTVNK